MPNPSNSDLVGEARETAQAISAAHSVLGSTEAALTRLGEEGVVELLNELAQQLEQARKSIVRFEAREYAKRSAVILCCTNGECAVETFEQRADADLARCPGCRDVGLPLMTPWT